MVWRAEDLYLERPVAVKEVFHGDSSRLLREGRAAARLSHPAAVTAPADAIVKATGTPFHAQPPAAAAIVATLLTIVSVFVSPDHFFRAYLMSYMLWLGVTLGCLAILMLQYLSGGTWGLIIRRQLQAASKNMLRAANLRMAAVGHCG